MKCFIELLWGHAHQALAALLQRFEIHRDNFFKIWIYFDKYMPRAVSVYPECHMVIIWSKFWQVIQKIIKNQHCYFFNLTSMLLMIFYVKTCLEFLQELSYFNFFITGKRLTYLRKILWPLSTASMLQPLQGGSLLFTIQFPKIPGTDFINLRRMKGWVDLAATQWFWTREPWIRNPAP